MPAYSRVAMMHRRTVLRALVGSVIVGCALPLVAEAQPPPKIPRIGYLGPVSPAAGALLLKSFRQGLAELGYVEGQTISIDYPTR